MKSMAIVLPLALAGALAAQVASQANSGYKTPQGRESVAAGLGSPERDNTEKPGVLIREMMLQPGMTVADIGTGIGYMLPFLSRRVGTSGRVIAEDIYDDFLAAAKQRATNQNLQNVSFVKGTDTDCNLPEGQVDMVLALDVYHHFDYPDKMLANINSALKPGGHLVIVDFYKKDRSDHIRAERDDVAKEISGNGFHLLSTIDRTGNNQYMLTFEKR